MSQKSINWGAVYNKLGEELYKKENYEEAIAEFSKALAVDNSNDKIYFNLGITLYKLGRIIEGIAMLKEAIRLNHVNFEYQNTLRTLPSFIDVKTLEEMMGNKYHIGKPRIPEATEKVVVLLGGEGVGKTTLVKGFINYIFGIKWDDDFYFEVPEDIQNKKQGTLWVNQYTIHQMKGSPVPYTLTVIDTPGYGNIDKLTQNNMITRQLKDLFSLKNGITKLDAIVLVLPNSWCENLNIKQQYILDSILSIFGKDVAANIFIMITFADGATPPVIEAMNKANIPYSMYFQCNNSTLCGDYKDKNEFTKILWEMNIKSLNHFFTEITKKEAIILDFTREVLNKYASIIVNILNIKTITEQILPKFNELQEQENTLLQYKTEREANKNFTRRISVPKSRRISLSRGEYTTNCLKCNCTCCYPCYSSDQSRSPVMNRNGYCTVCGCYWTSHVNQDFRYERYTETETRTLDDLKRKYAKVVARKLKLDEVINELNELKKVLSEKNQELLKIIPETKNCLERLDEIAIKPHPLTQEEYIDLLIEDENLRQYLGWQKRIVDYQKAKQEARILSNVKNFNPQCNLKEWIDSLRKS